MQLRRVFRRVTNIKSHMKNSKSTVSQTTRSHTTSKAASLKASAQLGAIGASLHAINGMDEMLAEFRTDAHVCICETCNTNRVAEMQRLIAIVRRTVVELRDDVIIANPDVASLVGSHILVDDNVTPRKES